MSIRSMSTVFLAILVILVGFVAACTSMNDGDPTSSPAEEYPPPEPVPTAAPADTSVEDSELGLSKSSVFATPEPAVPATTAGDAGENSTPGGYFSESPPMIPHLIDDFLPITAASNACIDCHDQTDAWDSEIGEGEPTPMPRSHYTDLRMEAAEVSAKPTGARYVCVQCHAAQSDAEPLVVSTYSK